MSLKYKATQKTVEALLRTVFRARVTGLENFPLRPPSSWPPTTWPSLTP